MNPIDTLIEKELITFSGQTFSDSEGVQKYVKGMMERVTKAVREESYQKGVEDAENFRLKDKKSLVGSAYEAGKKEAKERDIEILDGILRFGWSTDDFPSANSDGEAMLQAVKDENLKLELKP